MSMYKIVMKRTQIYITNRQHKVLSEEATKKGVSLSEIIRRVLDIYIDTEKIDTSKRRNRKEVEGTAL